MEGYAYPSPPTLERIPITRHTTPPEMVYHCLHLCLKFFKVFVLHQTGPGYLGVT